MRRLAEQLGIKAPSLYKHLPDKTALEAAIIATGFEEAAARVRGGRGRRHHRRADDRRHEHGGSGRRWRGRGLRGLLVGGCGAGGCVSGVCADHPHLYRLMHDGPLPAVPAGVEERPRRRCCGCREPGAGSALWAFAHGMVMLELDQRFPPDADLDAAWEAWITAFQTG